MKDLYSYIFTKAYFLCINIFKEKEFPQYFAIITVTLIGVTNLYIILSLIDFIMLPDMFIPYDEYFKYFSLASVLTSLAYFNYKERYKTILSYNSGLSSVKVKRLKAISIIYVLFIFIGFFTLGALLRSAI